MTTWYHLSHKSSHIQFTLEHEENGESQRMEDLLVHTQSLPICHKARKE